MKQTAVEWLENKVWELDNENFTIPNALLEMISYAKEMEKQQIIDAISQYEIKHNKIFSEQGILNVVNKAEQYYNQTFNK